VAPGVLQLSFAAIFAFFWMVLMLVLVLVLVLVLMTLMVSGRLLSPAFLMLLLRSGTFRYRLVAVRQTLKRRRRFMAPAGL
jgi:hypothetical protein